MKNIFLIALSLILSLSHNWAQPPVGQPTEKLEGLASDNLEKYDTWNALELYMKVYDRKPTDSKAIYDVAYTYFLLRDYPDAEEWFKKVLDADAEGIFKIAHWFLAYSMKLNGKYQDCIPVYEKFISVYDGDQSERMKQWAQIEIDGAKWAMGLGADAKSYEELKITNPGKGVNSALMENFAYPVERSRIVFSSLRFDTIIYVEKANATDKLVRIFYSDFDQDKNEWKTAEVFENEKLNKDGFHSANPTFSTDMSKFYFVRAKLTGNMLENGRIYYASHNNGTLGDPISLDFNNASYTCKNPAVGKMNDKEYLFFSSNMPGGKGGFDIWYAEINADGTTMQPLNLEAVNSVGDDSYPFYDSRDNNLYFASTGHPGLGGVDMFYSTLNTKNSTWGKVTNMGPGFNTSLDEFGFIINRIGRDDCYGYFVSNRAGTTTIPNKKTSTDDIFTVLMPERCDIDINVSVTDQNTKAAISGATVQLIDKTTGKVLEEKTNTSGNSFNFVLVQGKEYELATKKEGWESDKNVSVDTRKTALTAKFGSTENPMTLSESTFLKETGLIVETYNKKTGEPLSGVNVTVMGMANETLKENTSQSNKHEFKIPRTNDVKIRARLQGYVGETKTVAKSDLKNVQKLYLTPPPIFINVYFDFDKFNIRQGAVDTLDKIFTILNENLDMVVEVRGHTDSKGTNEYNETLAVNRSNASIDYLVKKGIDKSRLISKGFGENEPVAPNEDPTGKDDPAGRQLNRRVEFKVIKGEGATSNNESNTQVTTETEKKNQVTIVKAK